MDFSIVVEFCHCNPMCKGMVVQGLFVEVKDDEIFIDGKKVENNEFLFENKKIHVPTGIEYHGNMYVTLGLIALVIILHLINKKLRK